MQSNIRFSFFLILILFSTKTFGKIPSYQTKENPKLYFHSNLGQWDENEFLRATLPNGGFNYHKKGFSFYIDTKPFIHGMPIESETQKEIIKSGILIKNGNYSKPQINQVANYNWNYFLGNDKKKWASDVPVFEHFEIKNILKGVDMNWQIQGENLKYEFVLSPHANPNEIILQHPNLQNLKLIDGNLVLNIKNTTWIEKKPLAYQIKGNRRIEILCEYEIKDSNQVGFIFPEAYDTNLVLVIDPLLVFSTYSGSVADNWGNTATYDKFGNLYSGGIALSNGFTVSPTAYQNNFTESPFSNSFVVSDMAILKFDSTGSKLLYGTYLGGQESEVPHSLIVDGNNNLIILGSTSSKDFPTSNSAFDKTFNGGTNIYPLYISYINGSDIVLSKLSQFGNLLLASSFFGGSSNDGNMMLNNPLVKNYGDEFRGDIGLDSDDNIFIVSNTFSSDFPIKNAFQSIKKGSQDAIIMKLKNDLSDIIWSTFWGGNNQDNANSIQINKVGEVFFCGGTNSTDLKMNSISFRNSYSGEVDGFVAKFSTNGSYLASSYVGTSSYDQAYFVQIDSVNNVYLLGQTMGTWPITRGAFNNPNSGQFITKFDKNLSINLMSTSFGSGRGSPDISPTAFLVSQCGQIFLSGWGGNVNASNIRIGFSSYSYIGGNTSGLPLTRDAFRSVTDSSDFYLMVLSKNAGSLLYGTYFGAYAKNSFSSGFSGDHVDGGTSRFDKQGIIYQSVCASCKGGGSFVPDFYTSPNAYSNLNRSNNCNNAAFKFDLNTLKAKFQTSNFLNGPWAKAKGCAPLPVYFNNQSLGGKYWTWFFGDGTTLSGSNMITNHVYKKPGTYFTKLIIYDPATCLEKDSALQTLKLEGIDFIKPKDQIICQNDEAKIKIEFLEPTTFKWLPNKLISLNDSNSTNILVKPLVNSYLSYTAFDTSKCKITDSLFINVVENKPKISFKNIDECLNNSKVILKSNMDKGIDYKWIFEDGSTFKGSELSYTFPQLGNQKVVLEGVNQYCTRFDTLNFNIKPNFIPNLISPNEDGINDKWQLLGFEKPNVEIVNRWGDLIYQRNEYANDWNAPNSPEGVYFYSITTKDNNKCKGWLQIVR